jgi:hypothetical protein
LKRQLLLTNSLKPQKFATEVKGETLKKSVIVEGHMPQWNKYVEFAKHE